ncbi:MAG: electron transport complex subunit RsxC [Gammaproteobacteria bacterium]|jgi:electron transport complex protein RnfC|nr:electron transport complex subunit RsxC [Gammaproteobacteria bacterium]MDP6733307.1 electron transport complex subunit RsxC [Gammaproteobacteria bacterium]
MNPFNLLNKSFQNGVHPQHLKGQTQDLPIQRVPFGSIFVMPLNQHIGVPCKPVVEKNQRVRRGELIATAGGFVSTALHSPVTGRVKEIGEFRAYDGNFSQSIEIEADPYATQQAEVGTAIDWSSMTTDDFIKAVQDAGIVGMGGAAFPAHVKFSIPDGSNIRYLLINGAECEPYLTNDHRLMLEQPQRLLRGAEIVRQKLGAEEVVIGVELNKPDAIAALNQHIQPSDPVRVVGLEAKYPQGAEKMIISTIFKREVPAGQLPRDVEVNVSNVSTIVAIADYFDYGMPLIERIVTVSGPGVSYPANLMVPLGTTVRDVLQFCGGLKDETKEVIMGGPMMGRPIASLDAPVVKGCSGILAFTEELVETRTEYPCIRCGRCLEACPYFLNPARLARLSRARMFEEMEEYSIMDCVECGCCSYACPSSIPIVQLIRTGKDQLRNTKASQK